jgi:cytochrome c-type biogenesis protein CcmH
MSFWIAVALLSAITLLLLSLPLVRKPEETADRSDFDLTVFKDQLKELEKERERGLISDEDAETAKLEIQRRMLAADDKRQKQSKTGNDSPVLTVVLSSVVGIVVLGGALGLYFKLGSVGFSDVPYASRNIEGERRALANLQGQGQDISAGIAQIKNHLNENPGDVEAWIMLGRSLRLSGRGDEAVEAVAQAVDLTNRHPAVLVDYAETRIFAAQGGVDAESFTVLDEALQKDPSLLKARFYFGYAKAEAEDYQGALQEWTDLKIMSPSDAPWMGQLEDQMAKAAEKSGIDPATITPTADAQAMSKEFALQWEEEKAASSAPSRPMAGPTREDMEAAADMTSDEQMVMIRSMVQRLADRLKENPDDLEGWKRLVQVYTVLGEKKKADEAREMVKKLSKP